MPRVKARVLKTQPTKGELKALLQFNGKLPKVGDIITCKWGSQRSTQQNKFYWLYLEWILEHGGLKDEYLSVEELHETLKGRFLSKKVQTNLGFQTIRIGSTTELDKLAFGEYIDKIDKVMVDYCKIDTSPFFEEYRENYGTF